MRKLAALLLGLFVAGLALVVLEMWLRRGEGGGWTVVSDPPGLKYALQDADVGRDRGWVEGIEPPPHDPHRARVLCVGDSVTYGVQVKALEAWPHVLEDLLGEQRVEVKNFGLNGYDVEQVSHLVRFRLEAWHPDLIVWGNYQNDIFPTYLLRGTVSNEPIFVGTDIPESGRILPLRPSLWLLHHSAIFRRLQGAYYLREVSHGGRFAYRGGWYRGQVQAMRDWALAHDVPLLVLAIPAHILADMSVCPSHFPQENRCQQLLTQFGRITAVLDDLEMPWVDGLAAFRATGQPHFIPVKPRGNDGFKDLDHPNPAGHRVLAEALAPVVAQKFGYEYP